MPDATGSPARGLALVGRAAAAGDERAWRELVTRLEPVLRRVVKGYGLRGADVEDVVQTTWLRALCHIHELKDHGAIASWLAVTARREAMRVLQRPVREIVSDEPRPVDDADWASPERVVLGREEQAALRDAVGRLAGRQRSLLAALLAAPGASYDELSALLEMPIGSIGPTRERAFARLRENGRLQEVMTA